NGPEDSHTKRTSSAGEGQWEFSYSTIERALTLEPAILEELLNLLENEEGEEFSPLEHSHLLYVAVCNTVLQSAPRERGLDLLDRLIGVERGSRFLGSTTFRPSMPVLRLMARNSGISEVAERLEGAVDTITDDARLQDFALLFPVGEDAWLWKKIESDGNSGRELFQARALTVAGFAHDTQRAVRFLRQPTRSTFGWIENVRLRSLASAEKALAARYWFDQFVSSDDMVESWSAFRLMITCLDKRYSYWYESALRDADLTRRDPKMVFFRCNLEMTRHLIDEGWKKNIKDRFCHTKISSGIFPWMGGWTYPVEFDQELISGRRR
ncbi:MAG: hypothetical protein MPN21_04440, partial [Thermoanaerobaculia bacterium]|nr:hypothetical protein [Thermoanaerobaculia bacterium]